MIGSKWLKSPPWRVTWFLFFAAALNYADRAALSSVIIPLRAELGITDTQVGVMSMLFLWCYALASPFAGMWADRYSRSRIVLASLVAWSAVMFFTGFVQTAFALMAFRVALGVAESFYLPAAAALIGDHHGPETRGRAMGLHMTGLKVGIMVGGTLAGFLAEHFGWRAGFWILGGAGLGMALGSRFFLVDAVMPPRPLAAGKPRGEVRAALTYIARVPSFYAMIVCTMTVGVANWIFFTWLPVYFGETHGMRLAAAGLFGAALFKVPNLVGIMAGGWLSDWYARRDARNRTYLKALSFLLSGPILFLFLWAPTLGAVAVVLGLSTLIRSLGAPNEHPIVCDIIPSQYRSTAIGLLNACATAAGGAGVLLSGIFKADLGLNVIFAASSFFYVLAGAVTLYSYLFNVKNDIAKAREAEAAG
ncbi:MAG TPA: MFS transporter [Opitutaceae bacterium]|nr:MFS transporter [Opitutaceae bacterium]